MHSHVAGLFQASISLAGGAHLLGVPAQAALDKDDEPAFALLRRKQVQISRVVREAVIVHGRRIGLRSRARALLPYARARAQERAAGCAGLLGGGRAAPGQHAN